MITAAVHERIVSAAGAYGHGSGRLRERAVDRRRGHLQIARPLHRPAHHHHAAGIAVDQLAAVRRRSRVTATTSGGTLSYQWYEGASGTTTTPVGTNSPTFTTPALTATKSYWVRVSNECGNVASNAATVTVCIPPGIGTHPASTTINSGQTATLTVTATGSGPFTYQWYEGARRFRLGRRICSTLDAAASRARRGIGRGIYVLDRVIPPAPDVQLARQASESDFDLLLRSGDDFTRELGMPDRGDGPRVTRESIVAGQRFLWCDPEPVCSCSIAGPTPSGIRVNFVYTQPHNRRRGYASAATAAVSRAIINLGKKFCFLFTDLANPTSNKFLSRHRV